MRAVRAVSGILGSAVLAACAHGASFSPLPTGFAAAAADLNAGKFKSLYSFKSIPDGMSPAAGMTLLGGTLYGTTQVGGQADSGTVFTTSTTGEERVLYSFGTGGGPDGVFPAAGLAVLSGAFYGTTLSGGDRGCGTVFKIGKSGNERVLYSFKSGNDGANPSAALSVDHGALYGTTQSGGNGNCVQGCGTVFEVTTAGKEHVVYAFKGGNDGMAPVARLIVVNSTLYGTTASGGKNGVGTIFKTSVAGKEQLLHSFGAGSDGAKPEAGFVQAGGKLYGTTNGGGKNFAGTVFVTTTAGSERVLYSFKGGADGANPEANLIDLNGQLYGTTAVGGAPDLGTVFAINTSGSEHVLHAFRTTSEGSDPRAPLAAVNGALYGTTSLGGANGVGTIFKVSP
ncbi:MAG TPA: choice-of-anchor tandem repeat GloVer-containing protein [Candidatus Tumulicola sp.]